MTPTPREHQPTHAQRWGALAIALALLLSAAATALRSSDAISGEVRYYANDQRSAWVGVAPLHVETFRYDLSDLDATELVAVVRVDELRSGNALRDLQARRFVFDADEHPEVRFVLRSVRAVTEDAVTGAAAGTPQALRLVGDLSVRGTTRRVEVDVELTLTAGEAHVAAVLELSLAAFELPAPRFLTWVVDDLVRVEVDAAWPLDPDSTATTRPQAPAAPAPAATPPTASAAPR